MEVDLFLVPILTSHGKISPYTKVGTLQALYMYKCKCKKQHLFTNAKL